MFKGGAGAVLRANCGRRVAAIAKVFIKETFFAFMPLDQVFSAEKGVYFISRGNIRRETTQNRAYPLT